MLFIGMWSYSWPYEFSSYPVSFKLILILSSDLYLGLPSGLLPSGFLINILCTFLFSYVCYMSHPSNLEFITMIIFNKENKLEASHYTIVFILLLLHSWVQILYSAPFSQKPSSFVLLLEERMKFCNLIERNVWNYSFVYFNLQI